jgi:RNA recognition motif-containing protein
VYDTRRKARSDSDEEFLRKYDADRRSVFVGGLPYDVEKNDILELFSEVGDVVDIDLVKRTNNDGEYIQCSRLSLPQSLTPKFQERLAAHSRSSSSPGPTCPTPRSAWS